MSTQISFNAANVSPEVPRSLLPAGKYIVQITDSEVRTTKAGNGRYLSLTMEVLQGEHASRKIFSIVNIENANETAQSIGQAQLSAICHAVGVIQLTDTTQLHGRPLQIKVAIRKGKDGYDDQNDVKGYEAAPGAVPPPAFTQTQPTQQSTTKPAIQPPWA